MNIDPPPTVEYECSLFRHPMVLRLTKLKPDPNRWEGYECGYCHAAGFKPKSVLHRVTQST